MASAAVLVTLPSLLRAKKSQNRFAPAGTNNREVIIRPDRNGIGSHPTRRRPFECTGQESVPIGSGQLGKPDLRQLASRLK